MAAPHPGPRTEGELLQALPPSNAPGVFPRRVLSAEERVIYETRPGLAGLRWGPVVVLVLLDLLFLYVSIELVTNILGWVLVALITLGLVYIFLQWKSTAYALTDRRVLRVSGFRQSRFTDALYDQIQNLRLVPGAAGGIRFDATPPHSPTGVLGQAKYAKSISWSALSHPEQVYDFVQSAFALHAHQNIDAKHRADLLARVTANRIPCEYCGTLVSLVTIDYEAPKCPSCGAPLVRGGA